MAYDTKYIACRLSDPVLSNANAGTRALFNTLCLPYALEVYKEQWSGYHRFLQKSGKLVITHKELRYIVLHVHEIKKMTYYLDHATYMDRLHSLAAE
jgi:hypothetical protein